MQKVVLLATKINNKIYQLRKKKHDNENMSPSRLNQAAGTQILERVLFYMENKKVKVKCIFVQALRLCTGHTAYRGSRGIALLFLDHGTRRG